MYVIDEGVDFDLREVLPKRMFNGDDSDDDLVSLYSKKPKSMNVRRKSVAPPTVTLDSMVLNTMGGHKRNEQSPPSIANSISSTSVASIVSEMSDFPADGRK